MRLSLLVVFFDCYFSKRLTFNRDGLPSAQPHFWIAQLERYSKHTQNAKLSLLLLTVETTRG